MENQLKNKSEKSKNASENEIGLSRLGKNLTPLFKRSKSNGYALILFVLFCFVLSVTFTKPIVLTAARQYRDTNLEYAKTVSERIGIATASPIREKINSTIYNRIQGKLINHNKLFLSDSDTYNCQGQLVPTKKAGGKLSDVFSLCELSGIFDDLLGDTNQTIDFLGFLYPEHKTPIEDKNSDILRKSIIDQFQNKYDYTLRTIFVGQEILISSAKRKTDRFRFQIRADVKTETYYNVIDEHVLYYDVILDVVAHDNPFEGSGSNCDQEVIQPPTNNDNLLPGHDFIVNGPGGITYIFGEGGVDFAPLYVTDADGKQHPYGSAEYTKICGTTDGTPNGPPDPYCRKGIKSDGANCGTEQGGDVNCSFGDGTGYVGYSLPPSVKTRILRGCASARTGERGAKGTDPAGYSFTLTTRLSSVGSTFN